MATALSMAALPARSRELFPGVLACGVVAAAATQSSDAASARCTMSGSKCGRAFTSKMRATAFGSKASAARP